jgi:hypothetical protein
MMFRSKMMNKKFLEIPRFWNFIIIFRCGHTTVLAAYLLTYHYGRTHFYNNKKTIIITDRFYVEMCSQPNL